MKSRSSRCAELRRARPLLGTVVEITAPDTAAGARAIGRAFAAVARVHARMSAHEPTSDLGRLHRAPPGATIAVHAWTWRVLELARRFHFATGGAFDPIAAGRLAVASGRLPVWPAGGRCDGSWADVELLPRARVRLARPLRFDLGGIAKGFAVDRAVDVLRSAGLAFGLVNAGGDLRAFGSRTWPVHVRRPEAPQNLTLIGWLHDGAVASSGNYFSPRRGNGPRASALFVPASGRLVNRCLSASVFAPSCVVADALTKALLCGGDPAALRAFAADAVVLTPREGARLAA